MDSNRPVVARVPVIGNFTDSYENRESVKQLISSYADRILKVELLKEHNLAKKKYELLGKKMVYSGVTWDLMETYKKELEFTGLPVEIYSI